MTARAAAIAAIRAGWRQIAPGQPYEIDRLRPEDAPGVSQLIATIYDDKYPLDDYYDPARIIALNAAGDMVTLVGRTPAGDVVLQGALWRTSAPNPHLYECGQVVVLPDYRGQRTSEELSRRFLALGEGDPAVHALFGEAVTNHTATQRACGLWGGIATAAELSLMPDGAYAGEGAAGRRVGCVLMPKVLRDHRRALHLPSRHHDLLAPLASGAGLDRAVVFGEGTAPATAESDFTVQDFGAAGTIRCHVGTIGRDFPARLAAVAAGRSAPPAVIELFLAADSAAAPWAYLEARRRGFRLAGLMPLWFGADALVAQKLATPPDPTGIHLLTPQIEALWRAIEADARAPD